MPERHDVVVVGGGITGLATAFHIAKKAREASVLLLEKSERIGGIVGATEQSGFTVDLGPHGFVDNGADTRDLVRELRLDSELVVATREAEKISLLHGDELHPIPVNLPDLVRTELLSTRGKLRLAGEVLVPRRTAEESVVDFVARRFGREAAEVFAVPAVRGVVGGDARRFSIEGEFPLIKELERRYGSVLLGSVLHQARRRRTDPLATRLPSFREFGVRLKTFRAGGMQALVDALGKELAGSVLTDCAAVGLERGAGGPWTVRCADGSAVTADHVVVALPSDPAAELLRPHHARLADTLASLPHPDIRVLALGYRRRDVGLNFPGIGFIAEPGRRTSLLGAIHASSIFPGQVPDGTVLIRTLCGGTPDAPVLSWDRADAVAAVHADLSRVFGIRGEPVFSYDHIWRRPIPTYPVGHRGTMRALLDPAASPGGLHVAGNSCFGVGVNDCVRDARRAADEVLRALRGRGPAGGTP